jgi:hypothetical protein
MPTYEFRSGFRAKAVKADVVAAELERIQQENGALTSDAVFEVAKPEDAPLHPEYVWDGDEAVRQLGLIRSREIIRAVVVKIDSEAPEPARRVWVHVPNEDKPNGPGEYEKITTVVQHIDQFERALSDLQRKFDAAAEALDELRHAAQAGDNPERLAAIGLAVQGFGAVREALALLK